MASPALRGARFAVVDLETTGASAVYDRVTEVAVVLVERGQIVESFDTLVDPGVPIPPFITRLTGIDDRLVAGKPALTAVIPRLAEALDGRVFVAHNASFDHAFLKQGYARAGRRLEVDLLCTMRLARRLLPGSRSYSLQSLIQRLGLSSRGRHRALADAEATAALLLRLLQLADAAGLRDLAGLLRLQRQPLAGRAKRGVDEAVVQTLPDRPGVYLLKDSDGHVLYVGKSRQVRTRVRGHLRGDSDGQPRLSRRLGQVTDVEAIETGSELEALFLESKLIKHYLPEANVVGRNWRGYTFLQIDLRDRFPRFEVTREPDEQVATVYGPLRRAAEVEAAAEALQDTLGLRRCQDQLRPGMSACPLLDLRKCLGPCVRPEVEVEYGRAVRAALDFLEGRDNGLLERLTRRRDELAEALRFEEASVLRDRLRTLERLVSRQRRLRAVAQRNLVVVAPSLDPDCGELFFIRAGRLVEQRRVRWPVRPERLARQLERHFGPLAETTGPASREVVDEMLQLEGWLRRERAVLRLVEIDLTAPDAALPELMSALRGARASRRAARSPQLRAPALAGG